MKSIIIHIVRWYQKWISPMSPPRCKYYPSCSSYAITAISTYGLKGVAMTIWRLIRCNPWSYGGLDYVPVKLPKKATRNSDINRSPTR